MKAFIRNHRADLLLTAALIGVSLVLIGTFLLTRRQGAYVTVTVQGTETARYPLSEDREVRLDCPGGGYNLLVIRDGAAFVADADCPDKLCVFEPPVRYAGRTIVCLPHKTVITVTGAEGDVDVSVGGGMP